MKPFLVATLCVAPIIGGCAKAPTYDVVIRHGTIYDGTGAAGKTGDVAILDDRIAAIGEVKDERGREEVDATGLAVTPTHLNRIVKAATGLPEAACVEHHLLVEACRLLAYTTAPVASIGYALGYDDPSYFSRAFQRRIGMSPRTYRARATG